jgi:hypothetical protein
MTVPNLSFCCANSFLSTCPSMSKAALEVQYIPKLSTLLWVAPLEMCKNRLSSTSFGNNSWVREWGPPIFTATREHQFS